VSDLGKGQRVSLDSLIGLEALGAHNHAVAQRELFGRDGQHFTALWTSCLQNFCFESE